MWCRRTSETVECSELARLFLCEIHVARRRTGGGAKRAADEASTELLFALAGREANFEVGGAAHTQSKFLAGTSTSVVGDWPTVLVRREFLFREPQHAVGRRERRRRSRRWGRLWWRSGPWGRRRCSDATASLRDPPDGGVCFRRAFGKQKRSTVRVCARWVAAARKAISVLSRCAVAAVETHGVTERGEGSHDTLLGGLSEERCEPHTQVADVVVCQPRQTDRFREWHDSLACEHGEGGCERERWWWRWVWR